MNRLRKAVREADGRCRVAKNRLAKRAVAESPNDKVAPLLRGPLALIIGFGDPVGREGRDQAMFHCRLGLRDGGRRGQP